MVVGDSLLPGFVGVQSPAAAARLFVNSMNNLPEPPDPNSFSEDLQRYMDLRPLNESVIPQDLRDLMPWAVFWSIGDDVARSEVRDLISAEDLKAFVDALWPRHGRIREWYQDAMKFCPVNDHEACAFLFLSQALGEAHAGLYPDDFPAPEPLSQAQQAEMENLMRSITEKLQTPEGLVKFAGGNLELGDFSPEEQGFFRDLARKFGDLPKQSSPPPPESENPPKR